MKGHFSHTCPCIKTLFSSLSWVILDVL
ncbi:unnamed protein product [Spirodela intermedia]|uniref:Uncharacterized protein n=2 Tax=Spirodela intermedia TaxID=51605 RepID=A0A7I8L556_SPIIN|nr:unnamed protein product [Spirodela intermedia]CAA6668071.1 unnamed protein product [Spirodela intermedia]CAA7404902.1 unnamed protein product [Spirodela intermedia]